MLNRIVLIGRLVADAEFRVTGGGTPVASFTIAVDRNFKNQQGEVETDFIDIVVWRKQAEILSKWLNKGRMVAVDGRLQIRKYQNQEGQNRYKTEVIAERVQFLDRPKNQQSPDNDYNQAPPPQEPGGGMGTDDDLPF